MIFLTFRHTLLNLAPKFIMEKKLRFLIIEEKAGENHRDLTRAIEELGHEASHFRLSDVVISSNTNGLTAHFGDTPFADFDIIMPRTVSSNLRLGRLLLRLRADHQFILDHTISKRDTFGKLSQAWTLIEAGIAHPKVFYTRNIESFEDSIQKELVFPCITKPIVGSQGKGVRLIQSYPEALKFFSSLTEDYLFQEYLPIQADYRVFVIGTKVLGTMKRFVAPNDVRSNVSIGAKTEATLATPTMEKVALQAAAAFGYDISGVDIAIVGDTHYVLEVNRTPQWQGIKHALNIDPAKAIVEFCIERHSLLSHSS